MQPLETSPLLSEESSKTSSRRRRVETGRETRHEPSSSSAQDDDDINDNKHGFSFETVAFYGTAGCLLLVLTLIGSVWIRSGTEGLKQAFVGTMQWMEHVPVLASATLIVPLMALTTMLCIPYTPWAVGVGYIYSSLGTVGGLLVACLVVGLGVELGCWLSFEAGKRLLRKQTKHLLHKYAALRAMDAVFQRRPQVSIWLVAMAKLAPLLPAFCTNYGFAATSLETRNFVVGTALGAMPFPFVFVYMGNSLDDIANIASVGFGGMQEVAIVLVGLAMLVGAVAVGAHFSRVELERMIAQGETEDDTVDGVDLAVS